MAKSEYKRHFRDSSYFVELETDMLTMKQEPVRLLPNIMDSAGTGFENHEFLRQIPLENLTINTILFIHPCRVTSCVGLYLTDQMEILLMVVY